MTSITSDSVVVGSLKLSGGYFLQKDTPSQSVPFRPTENETNSECAHCFTYRDSVTSIKDAVLELVRSARQKIFIASFRLGDPDLLEALWRAADRLQGGIYVIAQLDLNGIRKGLYRSLDDEGPDQKALKKQFHGLTSRGLYVRGHASCHAKFLIVDDEVALISSANLESRAFTLTGENGVILRSPREVERLARFFTRLWYSKCEWELSPASGYTVTERVPSACPCNVTAPDLHRSPAILWTDSEERFILQTVQDLIRSAQHDLLMATFSIQGMIERPDLLLEPLRAAISDRGLRVRVLVRARNEFEAHRRNVEALDSLGVEIFADTLNHAKGVIADASAGALFSANFEAARGLTGNVEVGIRLDGQAALSEALRYFNHVMKHSDAVFAIDPTLREVDRHLLTSWRGRTWQSPWPLSGDVRVVCSDETWKSFWRECQDAPVLFREESGQIMRLMCQRSNWNMRGTAMDHTYTLERLDQSSATERNAEDQLKIWIDHKDSDIRRRGVCPAIFHRLSY